jgi:putative ABC transport system permease protein
VLLVNRTFANRYWGVGEAIGKRIFFAGAQGKGPPWEVVGVVGDIRHSGLGRPPVPEIYSCYAQGAYDSIVLTVRSRAAPEALAPMLRAEVAAIDPEQPVFNLRTMEDVLAGSTSEPRFTATLLTVFAALALVLAAAGISSVMAYSVAQRRRELGIRIALGATRARVLELVVREAMRMAGVGIAVGLLFAIAATRGLTPLLFAVSPQDPAVLGSAAALLAAVALASSLVPALRAARVDPLAALRSD